MESQVRIAIFIDASPGLGGFDIILLANSTVLRPAGVDLSGTVLLGTPTVLAECLGGKLVRGAACAPADSVGTLELGAVSSVGEPNTVTPTTGLLFTAIYNVTSGSLATPIGFQTGCSNTSVGPNLCVSISSPPAISATSETAQTAVFSTNTNPNFVLTANPQTVTTIVGNSIETTLTVTSFNNFSGTVALSDTISGPGPTATLTPNSVIVSANQTATSILFVSTPPPTRAGVFLITVFGTNGTTHSIQNSVQIQLTVNPVPVSDFAITASPDHLNVTIGSSSTSAITVTSLGGFTGGVSLSANASGPGPILSLSNANVLVPQGGSVTSILTVSMTNSTGEIYYNITVTGRSISISHSVNIALTLTPKAASHLAIDGSSQNFCDHSTNSCAAVITTQIPNDVLIVDAVEVLDLQPSCTFNIFDSMGLTWTARSSVVFSGTNRDQIQEFWAQSPHVILGDVVTEQIQGCAGVYGGEYNGLMVFGISGANVNSPFDPNADLPALGSGNSTGASVSVSTSNPNDMIIGGIFHGYAVTPTPGTGFNTVTSNAAAAMASEYEIVNSVLTNSSVAFGDGLSADWVLIGDAVQAASNAPVFSIAASPNFLLGSRGTPVTSTITASSFNNFAGSVSFSATVSPQTISPPTVAFNPASVTLVRNGTASSVLTIGILNSATPAPYRLTITGTNGTLTSSTSLTLFVIPPDFTLSVSVPSVTIRAGAVTNLTITVQGINSFNGTVTLSTFVYGPGGLIPTVNPAIVNLSTNGQATSTLTISAGFPPYTPSSFTVTIQGFGGTFAHDISLSVTVLPPPPDFSLNLSPNSLKLIAGQNETTEILLFPSGGFNGNVTLRASVTPLRANGPLVSINPSTVSFSQGGIIYYPSAFLLISTTSLTPPGNYTIILSGTSGSLIHTATLSIQILPPPTITINPTSGVQGTKVTVTGNGFPAAQTPFPYAIQIDLSFDDQFIGFTSTGNGAFSFTFNVPLAQLGQHVVKAETGFPSLTATAAFTVLPNPSPMSINLNTGTLYFPGDTATFFVLVTQNGQPVTISDLQLTLLLITPNGTNSSLTLLRTSIGVYKASYTILSTNSLGTYAVLVKGHSSTVGNAATLTSFEVKPTWLASHGTTLVAGATVAGLFGLVGFAWQQGVFRSKKRDDKSLDWNNRNDSSGKT